MELLKRTAYFFIGLSCIIAGYSCSNLKYVPKDDALYTGATVKIAGNDKDVSARERKVLRTDLQGLTRPKPNSKILGARVKLWANHIPFLRKKFAEPPVLLGSLDLEYNVAVLTNHLENRGFFRATVTGDTVVKRRKAKAVYKANPGPQYKIKDVTWDKDTSELQKNINAAIKQSMLKPGYPFNLDVIVAERQRIDAYLKERGFYYFSPEYLIVQTDTTIGDNKVSLYVHVKDETPEMARQVFYINDVYVYSNYSLNTARLDTNRANVRFVPATGLGQGAAPDTGRLTRAQRIARRKARANYYDGFYVIDRQKLHKPILFQQALQFRPNDVYNRTNHNRSLNRLINLNVFKFVKNRFEDVAASDTPKLDAYYYLTPLPKQSLRVEITGNTKSNNLTGSQVTLSWRNRNTFRAGQTLTFNATVGSEYQFSGLSQAYNTYRLALDGTLSWPRFVTPIWDIPSRRSPYVPRTNLELGYEVINRSKLYTLNSFKMNFGYIWRESVNKEYQLYPVAINYVQPANVTTLYDTAIMKNPTLAKIIEKQFVLGSYFVYNFNQLTSNMPANAFYFNGLVDLSGNIAGVLVKTNDKTGQKELFGSDFDQYIKTEADFRYYRRVGLNSVLANRIIVGFGYSYGNSLELPFIKQFFVGGTNSVRAFRSRSLGPGTYLPPPTTTFLPDQSGDIKLELNTEFRAKLYSVIHGAVFIDAGNVWLYRENPLKPGGKFTSDFLNELAVGTGVGLRFDFNFFVLRLDVAFPVRKPWLAKGNRMVLDQIDFGNRTWRRENVVFNLGIGYPF
jgi:outer membrane protein insertion porin family